MKWRNVFRHHPSVIIGDNRDDVFINLERYCGITFERPYEVRAVWLYANYRSNEKLARGHLEELKGKVNEDYKK
ncbi:hypothetical protein [Bacteriovorax sp. DB6_IX]|uniref:hypothetical protein n=1 Tax=Bacteriovorax sp. DB6_IX TaxID=1353530 RepID=UPI0012FCAC04|nr:hypothetical protein [Bacteriovorax sp. DB6_IX]